MVPRKTLQLPSSSEGLGWIASQGLSQPLLIPGLQMASITAAAAGDAEALAYLRFTAQQFAALGSRNHTRLDEMCSQASQATNCNEFNAVCKLSAGDSELRQPGSSVPMERRFLSGCSREWSFQRVAVAPLPGSTMPMGSQDHGQGCPCRQTGHTAVVAWPEPTMPLERGLYFGGGQAQPEDTAMAAGPGTTMPSAP
ncbi:hypothetical protein WJX74_003468 [Apatococcus lobatus]|uniref:Uncharacterized protein n=1 Tax=Apatococcus lobatus TaxID=904363 RepID=A0AAW1SAK9_9CHLO